MQIVDELLLPISLILWSDAEVRKSYVKRSIPPGSNVPFFQNGKQLQTMSPYNWATMAMDQITWQHRRAKKSGLVEGSDAW